MSKTLKGYNTRLGKILESIPSEVTFNGETFSRRGRNYYKGIDKVSFPTYIKYIKQWQHSQEKGSKTSSESSA